jgi:hypothetical protein
MTTDSTGRLRISNNEQIFSYIPSQEDNMLLVSNDWITTQYSTDGINLPTITYNELNNYKIMQNAPGYTDSFTITEETKMYMKYEAGCSRLTKIGLVPFLNYSNIVIAVNDIIYFRTGLISTVVDPNDINYYQKIIVSGIYFEIAVDNSTVTYYFALKHSQTTVTKIVQSSWNIDIFDGSGPSGKTINFTSIDNNMYIIIDEEYGSGRVRVGFNIDGIIYYAHQFIISDLNIASQYIETPYLPILYQMSTTGATITQDSLPGIINMVLLDCSSYLEKNKNNNNKTIVSIGTGITPVTLSTSTERVVLAIKLSQMYSIYNNINNIFKLVELNAVYNNNNYNYDDIIEVKIYLHTIHNIDTNTTKEYGEITGTDLFSIFRNQIGITMFDYYVGIDTVITSIPTFYGYLLRTLYVDKNGLNIKFTEEDMKVMTRYDSLYISAVPSDTNTRITLSATLKQV